MNMNLNKHVYSLTTHCVLNVYRNTLSIMIINW